MRLRARWAPAALLLVIPLTGSTPATADTGPTAVPVRQSDRAVVGQYIVTLAPELAPDAMEEKFGVRPLFTYRSILNGFAAALSPAQLSTVRAIPGVESVEENGEVTTGTSGPPSAGAPSVISRAVPGSWGQDRIDQRGLPLDQAFSPAGTGKGVTAYIVDTGIDAGHSEFGGRVTFGYDAVGDGRQGQDCSGHGTHVAGTVGGTTVGVAGSASLTTVRVLDCQGRGTWAGILAGLDWVARNAQQPAVVNASLGGPSSAAVDEAVGALWDRGILPVVAAGNDNEDACDVSPAGADRVVTVAASDASDRQTDFSNWGECVELHAPGAAIVSARPGGGHQPLDGTSMAAPHVAGVAVLHMEKSPDASPKEIADRLGDEATAGALSGLSPGSPDRLLYTAGL
ncbi:S8 family peptidase [Streptomyces sp. 24-1644]|uniref:S8 family peptidase n=1 Tax=Streptomyces sp. 24-1644 TaxID=3457315 RepID=UPI003FA7A282